MNLINYGKLHLIQTRTLLQVQYKDEWAADELFGKLMGGNVEPRRNFIQKYALEVSNIDT